MAHKKLQETKENMLCEMGQKGYMHDYLHCSICKEVIHPVDCISRGCESGCNAKVFCISGTTKSKVKHQFPDESKSRSICLNRPKQAKQRVLTKKTKKPTPNRDEEVVVPIGYGIVNSNASSISLTVSYHIETPTRKNKRKRSTDELTLEELDEYSKCLMIDLQHLL